MHCLRFIVTHIIIRSGGYISVRIFLRTRPAYILMTFVNRNHEVRTMAARGGDGGSDDRQECRYEQTRPGRLLLVHGLGPVPVNCDRAFNLFCLYGNVTTVKVIRDDKVLVEMEDVESAKRCVLNLHHLPLTDGRSMKVK